ncbi:hypothetical protein KKF91_02680 [Myxococcota bacterium]|nr:hypothetical protein [Myxococcota bacterium]MBU1429446.1 hypothetical protein [Myxococcota bacterium]
MRALLLLSSLIAAACNSSGGGGDTADGGTAPPPDPIFEQIQALTAGLPARPVEADFIAVAEQITELPQVNRAWYNGDELGVISVQLEAGGTILYQHAQDELSDDVPDIDLDPSLLLHPTWQADWSTEDLQEKKSDSEDFATRFPTASGAPDPSFAKDNQVSCPSEGRIAIVDFLWVEGHKPNAAPGDQVYGEDFWVGDKDLYTRLKAMGEAAGYTVNIFKGNQINLSNFKDLEEYDIVFTFGHGSRVEIETKDVEKKIEKHTVAYANETFDPNKTTAMGITYQEAFDRGYILLDSKNNIILDPTLFRDHYKPKKNQLWFMNHCWSALSGSVNFSIGSKTWSINHDIKTYSIAEGVKDSGVKVVLGYVTKAQINAVRNYSIKFFRRMFGGYQRMDMPPPPHTYWPGCMTPATFFRVDPFIASYAPRYNNRSLFVMFSEDNSIYFRDLCEDGGAGAHAYMQSFVLQHGTPATAFQGCWDTYWGHGEHPSELEDPLCGLGDPETDERRVEQAGCLVKIARKVTNTLLD